MSLSLFVGVFVLSFCNNKDTIKNLVVGRYIFFTQGEHRRLWDTVIIEPYRPEVNIYIIFHKRGFQRIKNNVALPKEFKEEKMIRVLDESHSQTIDQRGQLTYTFSATGTELLLQTDRYRKIYQ